MAGKECMDLPHIDIPHELRKLIVLCETCSPECCGLMAFDFSPMMVASALYRLKCGRDHIEQILDEIDEFEQVFKQLPPSQFDEKCTLIRMEYSFTEEVFSRFISELRTSVAATHLIFDLADSCKVPVTAKDAAMEEARRRRGSVSSR